jgi:hypothetical protein
MAAFHHANWQNILNRIAPDTCRRPARLRYSKRHEFDEVARIGHNESKGVRFCIESLTTDAATALTLIADRQCARYQRLPMFALAC